MTQLLLDMVLRAGQLLDGAASLEESAGALLGILAEGAGAAVAQLWRCDASGCSPSLIAGRGATTEVLERLGSALAHDAITEGAFLSGHPSLEEGTTCCGVPVPETGALVLFLGAGAISRRSLLESLSEVGRRVGQLVRRRALETSLRTRDRALSALRTTLESIGESVVITNLEGRVLAGGESVSHIGTSGGEILVDHCRRWAPGTILEPSAFVDRVASLSGDLSATDAGSLHFEDGRVLEWASRPIRVGDTSIGRFFSFRDITRMWRASLDLRASEERYRRLFEKNSAGAYRSSEDGRILECNAAFARLLGYESRQDVLDLDDRSLYFDAGERTALLEALRTHGELVGEEVCLRRRDGSAGWFLTNASFYPGVDSRMGTIEGTLVDVTAMRLSVQSAQEAEERYRLLFDGSPLPMLLWDLQTRRILACNEAAATFYGYGRDELRTRTITDLLPESGLGSFQARWTDAYEEGTFTAEGEQVTKQGNLKFVRVTAHGMRLGDRVVRFEAVLDLTEQASATAALRSSEVRYRRLFEGIPLPTWLVETESLRILEANTAAERHYGYSHAELLGMTVREILAPEEHAALDRTRASGAVPDGRRAHRKKDGTTIQVESFSHLIESEERAAHVLVASDITERLRSEVVMRRLQTSLRETAREWSSTFDTIESPVLITDGRGIVRRLNRAALALAGAPRYSDLVGRPLHDLGSGEPWREAARVVRMGSIATTSVQVRETERGVTWQLVTTPDPENDRVVIVAHDVSVVTNLQETVAKAQTMAAVGSLVSGVAHEVRNPLFGISATLDALEARLGDDQSFHQFTAVLRRQTERLRVLMQDLLDYGRPSRLELSPEPFQPVITQAAESCLHEIRGKQVEVRVEAPADLPVVVMDSRLMGHVLRNLIENAVQHSPFGGVVRIQARLCTPPGPGEEVLECRVEDGGPGIGRDDLPHVFEPFFTRRRGGTGLGLSIVRRITELHGGTATAANRPEGGTVMTIRLPVRQRRDLQGGRP